MDSLDNILEMYGKVANVLLSLDKMNVSLRSNPNLQRALALVYVYILDLHRETYYLFYVPGL